MHSSTAARRLLNVCAVLTALMAACSSRDTSPSIGSASSVEAGASSAEAGTSNAHASTSNAHAGASNAHAGANNAHAGANNAHAGASNAHAGANNAAGVGGAAGVSSPADGADCARDGDGRTTLVFVNGCSAAVTFRGSDIEGGVLAPGAASCVDIGSDVETISSKRYWGFRGEDPGAEHHSLAEFTFNTDFNDFDWYDISYVDAFNLPLQIAPLARPKCKILSCASDLLAECPSVGRFQNSNGELVACVSPDRNNAMSPVALYFESCDDAYAWSGDDQKGDDPSPMRACAGEDWQITFCPGAR